MEYCTQWYKYVLANTGINKLLTKPSTIYVNTNEKMKVLCLWVSFNSTEDLSWLLLQAGITSVPFYSTCLIFSLAPASLSQQSPSFSPYPCCEVGYFFSLYRKIHKSLYAFMYL